MKLQEAFDRIQAILGADKIGPAIDRLKEDPERWSIEFDRLRIIVKKAPKKVAEQARPYLIEIGTQLGFIDPEDIQVLLGSDYDKLLEFIKKELKIGPMKIWHGGGYRTIMLEHDYYLQVAMDWWEDVKWPSWLKVIKVGKPERRGWKRVTVSMNGIEFNLVFDNTDERAWVSGTRAQKFAELAVKDLNLKDVKIIQFNRECYIIGEGVKAIPTDGIKEVNKVFYQFDDEDFAVYTKSARALVYVDFKGEFMDRYLNEGSVVQHFVRDDVVNLSEHIAGEGVVIVPGALNERRLSAIDRNFEILSESTSKVSVNGQDILVIFDPN